MSKYSPRVTDLTDRTGILGEGICAKARITTRSILREALDNELSAVNTDRRHRPHELLRPAAIQTKFSSRDRVLDVPLPQAASDVATTYIGLWSYSHSTFGPMPPGPSRRMVRP
jgi:hypothetical protein